MTLNTIITKWLDEFGNELYRYALAKTNKTHVAEDLIQETYLAAFKSLKDKVDIKQQRSWLYSILKNKIADYFRAEYKTAVFSALENLENDDAHYFFDQNGSWYQERKPTEWIDTDESILDNIEFREVWEECLKHLPANWLAIIQLKILDEKENTEVCQELNITTTNLWQLMHRAKLRLRLCIEKNWINV